MAIQHRRLRAYALMPSLAGQAGAVASRSDIRVHRAVWGAGSAHVQLAEAGVI